MIEVSSIVEAMVIDNHLTLAFAHVFTRFMYSSDRTQPPHLL